MIYALFGDAFAGTFYIDINPYGERSEMAQIYVIGRVTQDLSLQISHNQNEYVRMPFAENIWYNQQRITQFYDIWAYGTLAKQIISRKVRKGSLLWISGSLILEEYTKSDNVTREKRLKVSLDNWGYIPAGTAKAAQPDTADAENTPVSEPAAPVLEEIDGERNSLP